MKATPTLLLVLLLLAMAGCAADSDRGRGDRPDIPPLDTDEDSTPPEEPPTDPEEPPTEPEEPPTDPEEPPTDPLEPACGSFDSQKQESAPIQSVAVLPPRAWELAWTVPAASTSWVDFAGTVGAAASHEGIDYIHSTTSQSVVDVIAASAGTVVYVRTGCPQSVRFGPNSTLRECGSGWGNHVILDHGEGLFTRYAHLDGADIDVLVGDTITSGQRLAGMGNSGRSDTRHLHFELGSETEPFDPCAPTRSFDFVHAPAPLGLAPTP